MTPSGPVLAFDFASPVASAAIAQGGELLAVRERPRVPGGDDDLLRVLDEVLRDARLERSALGGVIALRGPGSFTGTRVACATALGLAQALDLPATGVSSLEALSLYAPPEARRVLAVVDALRGEWFVQRFDGGRAAGPAEIKNPIAALRSEVDAVVACDLPRWLAAVPSPHPPALAARGLAGPVALQASRGRWSWDAQALREPLYLRAPATTRPR